MSKLIEGPRGATRKSSVIPGAQKKSHLACNHKARISPWLWRRYSLFLRTYLLAPPLRFADDKHGKVMESYIPPMLAA